MGFGRVAGLVRLARLVSLHAAQSQHPQRLARSVDRRAAGFLPEQPDGKELGQSCQNFHERWFPGDHSDVGGSHPPKQGGLWRCSFEWVLRRAYDAGLELDAEGLAKVRAERPPHGEPWAERLHDMLRGGWLLAEFIPKSAGADRTRAGSGGPTCSVRGSFRPTR